MRECYKCGGRYDPADGYCAGCPQPTYLDGYEDGADDLARIQARDGAYGFGTLMRAAVDAATVKDAQLEAWTNGYDVAKRRMERGQVV